MSKFYVIILTISTGCSYLLGPQSASCDTIFSLKTWEHLKLHK